MCQECLFRAQGVFFLFETQFSGQNLGKIAARTAWIGDAVVTTDGGHPDMSNETYVVAYEDSEGQHVLDYAVEQAKKSGASLYIIHVLEWSPYAFLTPQELEERHKRRSEESGRAQSLILDPAVKHVQDAGVSAEGKIRYGQVVEIVVETAKKLNASMIFVGRGGGNGLGARIFGSVPLGLAQVAPVPTVIVPQ